MSAEAPATLEVPLASEVELDAVDAPRRRPPRSGLLVVGVGLVGLLVFVGVFAPLLSPYNPREITGPALEEPSARHWLGTDDAGNDNLSRLIYGARASLVVAVVAPTLALAGAILVGVLPALFGGITDTLSNRLVVFLLALPGLPLMVLIASLVGPNQVGVILVIAFAGVALNARILRSQALALRQRGFIASARGFGGGPLYILRRHIVPGLAPLIVVGFVNWAALAIALEAGLAFLGLGDPTGVSWGLTLNRALAQPNIYTSPMWVWWVLPPGFAITLTVLGFTFVGVALEPRFNPRWLRSS